MEALDTFRKSPYKHNCAQAVANHWHNLYDTTDIVESYAPYVGGKAPGGYCGALYAAMQACPLHAADIERDFVAYCGASRCFDIKRSARTPCETCVETADKLVEKYKPEKYH